MIAARTLELGSPWFSFKNIASKTPMPEGILAITPPRLAAKKVKRV